MTKTRIAAFGESSVSHSSVHDICSVFLEPIEEEFDFDQRDLSGIISPVSSANFGTLRSNPRFARSLAGFLLSSLLANNLSTRRIFFLKHADLEKSSLFMRADIAKENIVERNQGTVSVDKTEKELEGLGRKPVNQETRILFDDELDVEKFHSSNGKMSGGKEVSSTDDCDYSQEPDQLSQCSALKVVDTFISLNDLGLSQDEFLTNENLDEIKNPPSSGLKGARCLTRTFSRSPIGKCDIFDSSHEDESGGDFFARKKEFMFPDKKCSIKPSRALHKSEMKKEPFENGKDKTKFRALCKINFSSLSDLRVKVPNKLQNSKSNKKINIHKESEPEINGNCSNQSIATKKESLQCASQQKIVSSIGGTRNSKRLLLSTTKLSNGTVMSSYVRNGEVSTAMVEPVDEISKGKDHLGVINSLSECKSSSNSREKILNGGESLYKDKDCLDVGIRFTPIARHTRQSRAEKSSNKTDVLLNNDTCKMKYQWNGHSTQDRESSFEKKTNSNKQHGTQIDGGSNLAKSRTRSSVRVVTSCQPKCKRICMREKMINREKPLDKDEEYLSADIRSTPIAWRTRKSGAEKSSNKTDALLINDTCKMKYQRNGHSTQYRESSFEKKSSSNKQHGTHIDGGLNLAKCKFRSSVRVVTSCQPKCNRTCLREKMINGEKPLDKEKEILHADIRTTPVAWRTRKSRAEKSSKKSDALLKNDTDEVKYQENGDFIQDRESSYEKSTVSNKQQFDEGSNPTKHRTWSGLRLVTSCPTKRRRTHLNYAENVDNVANPEFECELQRSKTSFSVVDSQTEATMKNMIVIQGTPELEALHREKIQPCNWFAMQLVSPVHIDANSLQILNSKCSSTTSIEKDMHRLKSIVATPTSALKKTQRNEDVITVRAFFSCHLNYDVIVKQEKILSRFEIPVASSISEATHFIADKFSRTRNMLESMAVGRPVVTHLWLESCEQAGFYVDEEKYILRDLEKEKEIGFIMPDSLACARERKLLQDKKVFITENVKPDRKTISNLVMASGGKPIERFHRSTANDKNEILVISCEEDCAMCIPLLEKGLEVFTSELVLNGIVIQKLEYERHRITTRLINLIGNLFLPEAKSK